MQRMDLCFNLRVPILQQSNPQLYRVGMWKYLDFQIFIPLFQVILEMWGEHFQGTHVIQHNSFKLDTTGEQEEFAGGSNFIKPLSQAKDPISDEWSMDRGKPGT